MSDLSKAVQDANAALQADASAALATKKFGAAATNWVLEQDPVVIEPPPPPPKAAIPTYGICPGGLTSGYSDAKHAKALSLAQELFQGRLWTWRVNTHQPDASMDRDVFKVQQAGGTPYLILYSSQGPRTIDQLPTSLANRYKDSDPAHFPIFTGPNEPDLNRGTKVHWDPAPLAAFQKQLYDQVKDVDKRYLVGSPAYWKTWLTTSSSTTWPAGRAKLREFITEQCKAGGVDFWAFHGYDDPAAIVGADKGWNIWLWVFPVANGIIPASETMSETAKAHGVNLPWVMDEGGANTGAADRPGRYTRLFDQAKAGKVANSTAYTIFPTDGYNLVSSFETGSVPTPAYTALKAWMATA